MANSDSDTTEDSEYSGLEEETDTSSEDESSKQDEKTLKKEKVLTEKSSITSENKPVSKESSEGDEYKYDSSDEEDLRNTVGNIPMEWYKEFEHLGYDLQGKKIGKPEIGDELEGFLKKMEDVNYWKTVKDGQTGQDVVLSDKIVDAIKKMKRGKYVDSSLSLYAIDISFYIVDEVHPVVMISHCHQKPWVDFFSHDVLEHPVTSHPPQKRSFIPSKWEKTKVGHLVHAMKMGWIKVDETNQEEREQNKFYMLWASDNQEELKKRQRDLIPAPKLTLPGHEESYNPPKEFLFTEEEEQRWKNQENYERKVNFIPKKFTSLRLVPAFVNFINERFERCLDLYLCPRQVKMKEPQVCQNRVNQARQEGEHISAKSPVPGAWRSSNKMNIDPNDLIPHLPKPKDLQPFPTHQALLFKGHQGIVRCIAVDPTGQWLISGSDDLTVRFWEVSTGRCIRTLAIGNVVRDVIWSPSVALSLVAIATEQHVLVINSNLGDKLVNMKAQEVIHSLDKLLSQKLYVEKSLVNWTLSTDIETGTHLKLSHSKTVSQLSWHAGGDYMAVCMPQGESMSVLIHQLSLCRTQNPFKKSKGLVQSVLFHPTRPLLFVATQRYIRIYNLLKQELIKKLFTNSKWVSSMALHPSGNHLIVGSYDCKLSWFDLDLSSKPYKTLRHHSKAIRQVCYHKKYPLFASASDDGSVIICHGMVFNDLLQNPVIVPVKILKGHQETKHLGVVDCEFHPTQPWIFSSGADDTIRLYS